MHTFEVITGMERYKVVDVETGGESYFDELIDAYKMASIIAVRLKHHYVIEDRKAGWKSEGGF